MILRRMRAWAPLALAAVLAAAAVAGAETPEEKGRAYFTELPLVTHEGKPVRFFTDLLQDRVVLITGFYVNCETVSPRENTLLSQLQGALGDRFGREVFFVSVTVDPKRDTPEAVAEYAKVWKPKPGWTFVTGKPENVDWVNYKLGQYTEDPETHRGMYLLGNLRTGYWTKLPPEAQANVILQRIEQVLFEDGRGLR